jgi:glycine/D-amino acid oxidase-like deaminating enzyme
MSSSRRERPPDIQILERGELAAATSSQAAGLVGQVRSSQERIRLAMASVALYSIRNGKPARLWPCRPAAGGAILGLLT